jgi:hypothetical protein
MIRKLLCAMSIVIALVSSGDAFGQSPSIPVEVIPLSPHTESPILLRVGIDRCFVGPSSITFTTPSAIRIDMSPLACPSIILGPVEFQIGRLPPGTYTVDVYYASMLRGSVTFSVVAAPAAGVLPIPTLSEIALLGLALVVGLIGTFRRGGSKSWLPVTVSFCIACAAAAFAPSPGGARAATEQGSSGDLKVVSNRLKIRFNRALLDPSREDILAVTSRPSTSPLAATLEYPVSIRRLIGREPTAYEEMLARKFPAAPEARLVQYYVLDYAGSEAALAASDRLTRDSRFEYVAKDPLVAPAAVPGELYVGSEPSSAPRGTYQWGFHALRFGDAFEKYTGSARVGVVDFGIALDNPAVPGQFHRDIRKNFRAHLSRNFTDVIAVGLPSEEHLAETLVDASYFYINEVAVAGPYRGHGTHVAGLIAADWDGNSQGVVGGCPDCSLLIGRSAVLSLSSLAAAIGHLVDTGVQAINMSFDVGSAVNCGSHVDYQDLRDALSKARAADVALVAAAGNLASPSLACPAGQSGVIAAGGLQSDQQSNLSFWAGDPNPIERVLFDPPGNPSNPAALQAGTSPFGSSYGAKLRLVAPAAEVLSTFAPNNAWLVFSQASGMSNWSGLDEPFTYAPAGQPPATISTGPANSVGWGTMTGTSMAAPHITALAGLVRTVNPLKPAASIENHLATSTTRTVQHAGFTFAVPDAGGAVNAALGNPAAPNRRTPVFGFWSNARQSHFYTTSPQEANAAMRGTLLPRPDDAWTSGGGVAFDFTPQGHALFSYGRFPQVMCLGTTPCDFSENFAKPRALFEVWTGHAAPGASYPLRPLYRLSRPSSTAEPRAAKYAYAVGYSWEPNWEVDLFRSQGYSLDALDGFIVAAGVGQPPGTVRLCRKQYAGTGNQGGDFVLFIDQGPLPACQAANDCALPNGNCGVNASYSDPVGIPALMGYVFPSHNANDDDGDSLPYNVEIAEGRNPAAKDNDIFASSRLFAHQQVRDIFRRLAEDFEVGAIASQIDTGMKTRTDLLAEMLLDPQHFEALASMIRLYRGAFDRLPDFEGLEFNARLLREGTTLESIALYVSTEEFIQRNGALTNAQFIDYCYWNVLGRAPDPAGYAAWLGLLDTGARHRGEVMKGFTESPEYLGLMASEARVGALYQTLLRRTADPYGYDFNVGLLDSGMTYPDMIAAFFQSPEYRLRFLPN